MQLSLSSISDNIMSSPESAPSSSAITRSHTPADQDDGEESKEPELPAKLQHLLAQVKLCAFEQSQS